jgi:hypothetical protein
MAAQERGEGEVGQGEEVMAPESRINEAKALAVLDERPGKWFCTQCWREVMSGLPEDVVGLAALARSKLRGKLSAVYEVDTTGQCDVRGSECQTRNEALYKEGGRALAVRRRPEQIASVEP